MTIRKPTQSFGPPKGRLRSVKRTALALCLSTSGLIGLAAPAFAEAPPAGTVIGNQAVVTFTVNGIAYEATSNFVQTTVNPVFDVTIEADTTKLATENQFVTFPHVITNVGNGPDTFKLTSAITGELSNVTYYGDDNCDGAPNSTVLAGDTTPTLQAGESYCVIVQASVNAGATAGGDSIQVTATSQGDTGKTSAVTDTVTVSTGPIINIVKSVGTGPYKPGDLVTVTLDYSNIGGADATNLVLTDNLNTDLDFTGVFDLSYVPSSARWDNGGNTVLDDSAAGNTVNGVAINFLRDGNADTTDGDISVSIASVPAGESGKVTFQVKVEDAFTLTRIPNTATADWDLNGTPLASTAYIPVTQTSTASIALTLNDTAAGSTLLTGAPTTDLNNDNVTQVGVQDVAGTTGDDTVAFATAPSAGSIVSFPMVLTNHAISAQRFNLTASNVGPTANNFPTGTTFSFRLNGSPLLDSNLDGVPDVNVAANSAVSIDVLATLPLNSVATTNSLQALVTATSITQPSKSDQTRLQLPGIAVRVVDLVNGFGPTYLGVQDADPVANFASDDAANGAGGTIPFTTVAGLPGSTVTFALEVRNNSAVADTFQLSSSGLPSNWIVTFSTGTNTGVIPAGGSVDVTASVTIPATTGGLPTLAGTTNVTFRAESATVSSIFDTKLDAVTVSPVVDVSLAPDREGNIIAGGAEVLTHTLTNSGNDAVTINLTDLAYAGPGGTFSKLLGSIYLDNGDRVFDLAADAAITSVTLARGASITVYNRVSAPSTLVAGVSDDASITVTVTGDTVASNNTITDTFTIVSADLVTLKQQGIDRDCNGSLVDAGDVALTTTALSADPGQCILYQVEATNSGTVSNTDVFITDATPAFTTLVVVGGLPAASNDDSSTAALTTATSSLLSGSTGQIKSEHGTLVPGATAKLEFLVKIDK